MKRDIVEHLLKDVMYLQGGPRYTLLPGEILHANRSELDALLPRLLNSFDRVENCLIAWVYRMSEIDPAAARASITGIKGFDRETLNFLRATVVYVEGNKNPEAALRYFLDHYDELDSADAGYFRGNELITSFVFLDAQKRPERYEETDDETLYEVLEGYTLAMIYTKQVDRALDLLEKYNGLEDEYAAESITDVLADFWPLADMVKAKEWAETQPQAVKEDVVELIENLQKLKLTEEEKAINLHNQINEQLGFRFLESYREIVRMGQGALTRELNAQRVQYQQMTAHLLVHRLAEIDAQACLEILIKQDMSDQWITSQSYLLGIAYAQLAKKQPLAAARGFSKLLREPLPITSGGLRGNYAVDVGYTFCYELAKADSKLALKAGGKKWGYPHAIGGNEGQGVVRAIIEKGELDTLIKHFKNNIADNYQFDVYNDLAQGWPQLDPDAAIEWFGKRKFDPNGNGEYDVDITFAVAQGLAYQDPDAAVRFLQTHPAIEKGTRGAHLKNLLENANPHLAWRLNKTYKLKIKLD
ncbi:MAG: hypothetical protein ACPGUY_00425 [Akkermansiaceae bacterium]